MKKLGLVSALSLGLILLAGCNTGKPAQGVDNSGSKGKSIEITSSDDMISLYNESNAITCNLTYNEEGEEGVSVMYIKDGMISQKTESTFEGEDMVMYTLAKDGKMYVWGNVYGEGVGMSATYDIDLEKELAGFDEIEDSTKVTCTKGVKNNSVFNLPTDIEFTSMDDWLNYDDESSFEGDEEYDEAEESSEENVEGNVEGNVEETAE